MSGREFSPQPKPLRAPKPPKRNGIARKRSASVERSQHYGGAEDWPALKLRVLQRDRYRCVACDADNPKRGTALECAHIRSVGMGGRSSGRSALAALPAAAVPKEQPRSGSMTRTSSVGPINDEALLVTLCRKCHQQFDQGSERSEIRARVLATLADRHGYQYL
jgi:5-methylcytosine-specific restriction endonuclease McrA